MITLHHKLTKSYTYTKEEERTRILGTLHNKIENELFIYNRPSYFKIIEQKIESETITKVIQKSTNKCVLSIRILDISGQILYYEEFSWEPTKLEE